MHVLFHALLRLESLDAELQRVAVKHLLVSVTHSTQCFWYAHPLAKDAALQGQYTAEFSNGNLSRSIPVTADYVEEVRGSKYIFSPRARCAYRAACALPEITYFSDWFVGSHDFGRDS